MPVHPCPCCGYRTLTEPPPGSYQICPVCFWEDTASGEALWVQSNGVDLRDAQRNFLSTGVCAQQWSDDVRAPTPAEAREPGWLSFPEQEVRDREPALAAIQEAFGDLVRGDGMRVYEAELADDYGYESPRTAARRDDNYQRWWEIPDEVIATHYSVLSFFDPAGLRFHMPAYISFALRDPPDLPSNSPEFTVYALEPGEGRLRAWSEGRFAAFDDAQARAIGQFLRFTAMHVPYTAHNAQNALDAYWTERERASVS